MEISRVRENARLTSASSGEDELRRKRAGRGRRWAMRRRGRCAIVGECGGDGDGTRRYPECQSGYRRRRQRRRGGKGARRVTMLLPGLRRLAACVMRDRDRADAEGCRLAARHPAVRQQSAEQHRGKRERYGHRPGRQKMHAKPSQRLWECRKTRSIPLPVAPSTVLSPGVTLYSRARSRAVRAWQLYAR